MAKATVVIPNYNGMKYLPQCIEALRKQTVSCFDILVVENGSSDGSAEWLEASQVPMLKEEENLGFAGGVNAGIRACTSPYVILLNNDTEVFPDFVEALIRGLEAHPRLFAVSARMLQTGDRSRMDDAGDGISLFGWAWQRGNGQPAAEHEKACDIFSACGGAAIYRRAALEETGLFDEAHFAYLEDIDLSWRAWLYGWFIRYCPEAKVYHYGSATSGSKYNEFKVHLSARNHIWLMYKNQPDWQLLLNAPWLAAGLIIKACFFAAKGMFPAWLKGTAEGFRDLSRVRRADFARAGIFRVLAVQWQMITGTGGYLRQYAEKLKVSKDLLRRH